MRRVLGLALAAPVILALTVSAAAAQTVLDSVQVRVEKLGDGVYLLRGAGGNVGLCAGTDGAFLVDGEMPPLDAKLVAAVRALGDPPICFLLDTHWHGDHTGSNESFARAGALVIAHDNVRARLATAQRSPSAGRPIPAAAPAALPSLTFTDSLTLHLNGEEIGIVHVPAPGHTDGDAVVRFRNADVIHAGDLFFNGTYPVIDLTGGGSIDGMIAGADRLLAMAGEGTKIIPGHGPLADRAALSAYRDMLAGVRERVADGIAAGRTREQVVASRPTAAFDEAWGKGFIKPDAFASVVYTSLARK